MSQAIEQPRIVKIRENVLKKNDILARELRKRFQENRVYVVNLVSSPGAGKTTLLTEILTRLGQDFKAAALVGDLATENDAERLKRSGAIVKQITTGTVCHLEAQMIEDSIREWDLRDIDFLFIENVGNLVCPSSYDLGENLRVVLFSTTEGEDKPVKYPTIVNSADIAIITKMDLAEAVDFDKEAFYQSIYQSRPTMKVFEVSVKQDMGINEWIDYLIQEKMKAF
ncbi:hydrogenase nickel incorporation protein HypB [Ureibacillus sp. FSL K6-8385]|uniref:hydrogenase nickel incorporation protein HypB n=1 Tax=Ureibacillus TaxID=160795 RepID=UPI001FE3B9D2|nr:hydrogenase nickel incorporation protein HypB [Ureibacillus terrenus]MED3661747.1 hydrogenase nickel incorporation protein HypB [Ureibacillus terrenus]MED3763471.1 hydrogenase nickel incorporation protein HypB [Ureibacillus terrenus]